jgi:hypothetical protein
MWGEEPLHIPPNLSQLKEAEKRMVRACWADRNWLCKLEKCEIDCPVRARYRRDKREEGYSYL